MKRRPSSLARATLGLVVVLLSVLVSGCGLFSPKREAPVVSPGSSKSGASSAVTPDEGYSRYGNPESYEVFGIRYHVMRSADGYVERGIASWYGPDFHGRLTSTREVYDMYQMTAAHKQLPLPTWVEVTNLENGRRAVLKVNDRGPFKDNRILDLSYAAALKLDVIAKGTARVEVRAIPPPSGRQASAPPASMPPPPSPRPTPVNANTVVQLGAYVSRQTAEAVRGRLAALLKQPVRTVEETLAGRTLYKVQVGPLASEAAQRAVAVLEKAGFNQPQIIKK